MLPAGDDYVLKQDYALSSKHQMSSTTTASSSSSRRKSTPPKKRQRSTPLFTVDASAPKQVVDDVGDLVALMYGIMVQLVGGGGVEKREVVGKGNGVFTTRKIKAETIVLICSGTIYDAAHPTAVASDRVIGLKPVYGHNLSVVGDSRPEATGADVNHSCCDYNCRFQFVHDDDERLNAVVIRTLRDLAVDEELLVDYGDAFFRVGCGKTPCMCCGGVCPKGRMFP